MPRCSITRIACTLRQYVSAMDESLPRLVGRDKELVMGGAVCDWIGWK